MQAIEAANGRLPPEHRLRVRAVGDGQQASVEFDGMLVVHMIVPSREVCGLVSIF